MRVLDHAGEGVDDVLSGLLDPQHGGVGEGVSVLGGHESSDAGLLAVTCRRMSQGDSHEDDGLNEQGEAHLGHQDGVDAAQLGVDLEAEVGENPRRGARYVLGLDALRRDAEDAVLHPFYHGEHRSLAGHQDYYELKFQELFTEVVEHLLNVARVMDVLAEARLAKHLHSEVTGDLSQSVHKIVQILWFDGLLWREASYGPVFDSFIKLLAPHVPDSLTGHGEGSAFPAPVLQLGRIEDSSLSLHHLQAHVEAELPDEGVIVEVRLVDGVPDIPLPIRR